MSKLSTKDRKNLDKSQFAVPEKAPGSGSYPIPDANHARDALSRSSGKPVEDRVRAAVKRKYPDIKVDGASAPARRTAAKVSTEPKLNSVQSRVHTATQGNKRK